MWASLKRDAGYGTGAYSREAESVDAQSGAHRLIENENKTMNEGYPQAPSRGGPILRGLRMSK